jgi:predicted RNA-binding Zn-ribbon protein involved in translation (DUF1610 family)
MLQACSLRDWNVKDIIREFTWFELHKYYFQLHLLPRAIFAALYSSKSRIEPNQGADEKRIIPCDSCGQKLRVPKMPVSLKVNCPKCGYSFMIGNDRNKI